MIELKDDELQIYLKHWQFQYYEIESSRVSNLLKSLAISQGRFKT
jgi:hypothetical protein